MHDKVIQVSLDPNTEQIHDLPEWFSAQVDYWNEEPFEKKKFTVTKEEVLGQLQHDFDILVKSVNALEFEDFCKEYSVRLSNIKYTLDDKYETWYYYEYDLFTRKEFLRYLYDEFNRKNITEITMHIINVFDYHC